MSHSRHGPHLTPDERDITDTDRQQLELDQIRPWNRRSENMNVTSRESSNNAKREVGNARASAILVDVTGNDKIQGPRHGKATNRNLKQEVEQHNLSWWGRHVAKIVTVEDDARDYFGKVCL